LTGPDARAELEAAEPALLRELADDRRLVALAGVDASTRRGPELLVPQHEAHEENVPVPVEDQRSRRAPEREPGRAPGELLEPAQPLGPRHGRVCRSSRREHEETRVLEPARLQAELGALAERAPIRLLAD